MKRRTFIAGLLAATALVPLRAKAKPERMIIGMGHITSGSVRWTDTAVVYEAWDTAAGADKTACVRFTIDDYNIIHVLKVSHGPCPFWAVPGTTAVLS